MRDHRRAIVRPSDRRLRWILVIATIFPLILGAVLGAFGVESEPAAAMSAGAVGSVVLAGLVVWLVSGREDLNRIKLYVLSALAVVVWVVGVGGYAISSWL
jgi:hypothetical protein